MHIFDRPISRLHCSEPLEGRCLLSASGVDADSADSLSTNLIEVIEIALATEDGADEEIALSSLPKAILEAVQARFPGARILEAELDAEEGELEYGLILRFAGEELDVELTDEGFEVERAISSRDLPAAVLEWLRENYPGAEIDEAAIVTGGDEAQSYELVFTNAEGQEIEATLRVEGESAPAASDAPTAAQPPPELQTQSAANALPQESGDAASSDAPTTAVVLAASEPAAPEGDSAPLTIAAIAPFPAGEPPEFGLIATPFPNLFESAASVLLPQLSDLLSDAMPIDVAAVERELERLMNEITLLLETALGDDSAAIWAMRFAAVAALVAGAHLLLDLKKSKGGPVLLFGQMKSNWSWVVGAPK